VSFHDGDTLLGQTTADSDHTFTWTPTEALTDGQHTITAHASLGGETSLPSRELLITVDSTLPFDPAGVHITYAFHDTLLTQTLKDSEGCTALMGNLDTSFYVRPDSTLTVTIPIRTDMVPGNLGDSYFESDIQYSKPSLDNPAINEESVTRTIRNTSPFTITGFYYAEKDPELGDHVYLPYKRDKDFEPMIPGDIRTVTFDANTDVVFKRSSGVIAGRELVDIAESDDILIKYIYHGNLVIKADSSSNINYVYLKDLNRMAEKNFGGSLVSPDDPLESFDTLNVSVPYGNYYVILRDDENKVFLRSIYVAASSYKKQLIYLDALDFGVDFTIKNDGPTDICGVRMLRYEDSDKEGTEPKLAADKIPNLLDFAGLGTISKNGGKFTFKLESGRYYIEALDCNGKTVFKGSSVEIHVSKTIRIGSKPCDKVGNVKAGDKEYPILCPGNLNTDLSSAAVWSECYAVIEAIAEALSIDLCVNGSIWDLLMGLILIDPDGYVYDAAQGVEAVIQGATVTCDMYDEDYQTWERWPAELYESQINPQVTGSDGYYAFFVPPGLYRVKATAFGYDPHTSPDIRVINEVVHYNIPMTGGGGALLLPFLVR
jgi:hypothetical protein